MQTLVGGDLKCDHFGCLLLSSEVHEYNDLKSDTNEKKPKNLWWFRVEFAFNRKNELIDYWDVINRLIAIKISLQGKSDLERLGKELGKTWKRT